jgi:multimeric flavodoxin WrbA
MKNILIIKTSPRKGGNSDQLAEQFAKGAREAGHNVEEVSLADKAGGVTMPKDIKGHVALQQAYELGKGV